MSIPMKTVCLALTLFAAASPLAADPVSDKPKDAAAETKKASEAMRQERG